MNQERWNGQPMMQQRVPGAAPFPFGNTGPTGINAQPPQGPQGMNPGAPMQQTPQGFNGPQPGPQATAPADTTTEDATTDTDAPQPEATTTDTEESTK